jgi:hypothetical protein
MPYIKSSLRAGMCNCGHIIPINAGELNYAITDYCIGYVKEKGLSYQTINDIMGALEGAKAEFYRRVAVPYEETKIKENGDVY